MSNGRPVVTTPVAAADVRAVYKRLFQYSKPHWKMAVIGGLGAVIFSGTNALIFKFTQKFLNETFVSQNPGMLAFVPIAIVVLFLIRSIGDYVSNYFPGYVGRRVVKQLRTELFSKYMRLPVSYYDRTSTGDMMSRLTYNIEMLADAGTSALVNLTKDALSFIVAVGYLFYLNWKLAALVILLAPPLSWLLRRINQLFRRYSSRIQASMGDITRVTKEGLDGQRVIKAFNAQAHEIELFEQVNERNRHSFMRLIGTKSAGNPVVQVIASFGLAVVLYFAVREVLRGEIMIGDFVAFLAAIMLASQSLRSVTNGLGPVQQGVAAGQGIFDILDLPEEPKGGGRRVARVSGEVEFRDVHFEYAAEKGAVLRGINLKVQPRTTCAIVGKSGSGKSTLVSLLPRFYDPQQGAVLLDGVDVRDYALEDVRNQVSIVSQDVMLFNDSIRNNIALGMKNVTEEAIIDAARAAYVLEFSQDLPEGLNTNVGDRGSNLSGGQRQRVAIARALLKNAPILVLDEATSALDTESERRVQEALETLKRDRTTLVIAHRLSTVEHADRIIVMHEGQIVESGTHAELLARDGTYAALYHLKFSE